jgi:hypothetical protein
MRMDDDLSRRFKILGPTMQGLTIVNIKFEEMISDLVAK